MNDKKDVAYALISALLLIGFGFVFFGGLLKLVQPSIQSAPPLQEFLWTYRGLDVLVQAFLIFAAMAAVGALFRVEKGPGSVETAPLEDTREREGEMK